MSSPPDAEITTTALDVLAKPQRRYLLATLLEREDTSSSDLPSATTPTSMPIDALATEVAAMDHGCPIVTEEQSTETHVALVHSHVPRLVDGGLVTRLTEGDTTTVALADHPVLATEWVQTLLADPTGEQFPADETTLNRTLAVLRNPRRRTVCNVLARRRGTVSVHDLAALVVAREGGDGTRLVDVTETDCSSVVTSLVHEHLPALSDVGLVADDETTTQVELAIDAPQWQVDWIAEGPLAEAADVVRGTRERRDESMADESAGSGPSVALESETDDPRIETCRTVRGRETVVATGHEIADSADEELFLAIPDADMIGQTCLQRWRDAADRGVDVYVGSHSPRVRDTVRSAVPGATVCEPRLDWLNLPIERGNHGHIVFADREQAMIVTIDELDSGPEPRVGAITGRGRGNALVSLLCEHMGPRLDQLTTESNRDTQDETPLPI